MAKVPSFLLRGSLLGIRLLQWASAVIVMGIMSFFINEYPKTGHVKYEEVIAVISVGFFLPGLVAPFIPRLAIFSFPVDIIFSYLWLTSFIFTSQDYSTGNCPLDAPPGGKCSLKRAVQAFTFLAFFFTLSSATLEIFNLWFHHRENKDTIIEQNKELPRQSGDTAVTGTTAGQIV